MISIIIFEAIFLAQLCLSAGFYTKGSPVLSINAKSYNSLIAKSNYTSIVEFYAPWCGHCQNLKPLYEKAAESLDGIAKVAAINCDDDENKPFCGSMGIQGFPTLKIVKPSKKLGGRPSIEDYQGARTTKAIREAVLEKIPNHVTRLKEDSLDGWLKSDADQPKALVFSDKSTVSPLIKAVAIDFLGVLAVGQIRSTDKTLVKRFDVASFPTVLLLPDGSEGKRVIFDGDVKKNQLVDFLSQAASPNPSAAPPHADGKTKSSGSTKKAKKEKERKTGRANNEKLPEEEASPADLPELKIANDDSKLGNDHSKPAPQLISLDTKDALQKACVHSKSATCIVALPSQVSEGEENQGPVHAVLSSLAEIAHKHSQRGAKIFPFYQVTDPNVRKWLATSLGVDVKQKGVEVIAINAKRGWWLQYVGVESSQGPVESWIDTIRFGEGARIPIPEGVVVKAEVEPQNDYSQIPVKNQQSEHDAKDDEFERGNEEIDHDEL